jgi:YVTN family beta-propeller protein
LADVVLEGSDRHILDRLNDVRLTTQIEQIDAELELGRHAQLVGELEALVAAHPYQEKLAAQLMLAFYRSGRQADALDVYRAIRGRLDDELGLQPGQELRALEAAILRQDDSLVLAAPLQPSSPGDAEPVVADRGVQAAPRWRRRRVGLAAAGVVAVVGVAVALAFRTEDPPLVVPPNSVAVIDAGSNRVRDVISVGIRPGPVAAGEGAVWVGNLEDRSLSRIDPESATVVKNVRLPATPSAIAVGVGAVWVVNGRLGTLYQVDPSFNEVARGRRVGTRAVTFIEGGVAVQRNSVWAAFGDSTLARVDGTSLHVAGLTSAGEGPAGVVTAFGSVWVSNSGDATVQRFSPLTFEEGDIGAFKVGRRPTGLAAGEGAIWVACTDDDYVARLDPSLGFESQRPIPVGDGPTAVAVGGGAVWVANAADGTVSRIDPESNEVVETIALTNPPSGLAFVDGSVWVAVQAP